MYKNLKILAVECWEWKSLRVQGTFSSKTAFFGNGP